MDFGTTTKTSYGLNIMRKAGDIGNQIGDYYDLGGDGAILLGTGLDVMGMPEYEYFKI